MVKDILGQEIKEDARIAFAVQSYRSTKLNIYRVTGFTNTMVRVINETPDHYDGVRKKTAVTKHKAKSCALLMDSNPPPLEPLFCLRCNRKGHVNERDTDWICDRV